MKTSTVASKAGLNLEDLLMPIPFRYAALSILLTLDLALPAFAQDATAIPGLAEQVQTTCKAELETFCRTVTPGEGRLLACLYAYNDKLSGACEYALLDAAAQLDQAISALEYVANECQKDIDSLCTGVTAGRGRIVACLASAGSKVSAGCAHAIEQTGLKDDYELK
jgi:hypothetical protein